MQEGRIAISIILLHHFLLLFLLFGQFWLIINRLRFYLFYFKLICRLGLGLWLGILGSLGFGFLVFLGLLQNGCFQFFLAPKHPVPFILNHLQLLPPLILNRSQFIQIPRFVVYLLIIRLSRCFNEFGGVWYALRRVGWSLERRQSLFFAFEVGRIVELLPFGLSLVNYGLRGGFSTINF